MRCGGFQCDDEEKRKLHFKMCLMSVLAGASEQKTSQAFDRDRHAQDEKH